MIEFPFHIVPENNDEKFMLEALKEALKAFKEEEVPIGAVLVHENRIIARGHNQVEMLHDATAHAEMLCITAGAVSLENWRLTDTTLYSTLEPCAMCAGAAILSRVSRICWGAKDIRQGANGSWVDLFSVKHPIHEIAIEGGVLEEPSAWLMKEFFKLRREKVDGG